jgi:tetratricopeptide (TPR) repeat protein
MGMALVASPAELKARLFHGLSDPSRLAILDALCLGPRSVGQVDIERWGRGDPKPRVTDRHRDELSHVVARLNELASRLQAIPQTQQQLAVYEDRIARNLHHSEKQQAFAIATLADTSRDLLAGRPRGSPPPASPTSTWRSWSRSTEIATLVGALHPLALDSPCRRLSARAGRGENRQHEPIDPTRERLTALAQPGGRSYPHGEAAKCGMWRGLLRRRREREQIQSALSLEDRARRLQEQGRFGEARPLFERALAIAEEVLGPDDPGTASCLNNLALLLQAQGDLVTARPLFERALVIHERELGPLHPYTAACLGNLAELLEAQGELAAARPMFERALAIAEATRGSDHPHTATALNNLGGLLQAQGELAAARPLYERALSIRERTLGPDHPHTAQSLNNLALLLEAQGELSAARPLFDRALDIRERVLGPDHPLTARSLNNLALLLEEQGQSGAARSLCERALATFERALGHDHPDMVGCRENLTGLLYVEGDITAVRLVTRERPGESQPSAGPPVAGD